MILILYHLIACVSVSIGHTLYEEIEKQTGIPKTSQMLSYNSKLIHPNVIPYGLTHGSCINLLIKGIGGGGTETGSIGQPNNDHFYYYYPNFIQNLIKNVFHVVKVHTYYSV